MDRLLAEDADVGGWLRRARAGGGPTLRAAVIKETAAVGKDQQEDLTCGRGLSTFGTIQRRGPQFLELVRTL
jgi:hypothetical protein